MRTLRFTGALLIAIGVTSPALAQQAGGVRGACMNDLKTLCGSVQPGGGRIRDCIRAHRAQLSEGCKVALAERFMQRRMNRGGRGLYSEPIKPDGKQED